MSYYENFIIIDLIIMDEILTSTSAELFSDEDANTDLSWLTSQDSCHTGGAGGGAHMVTSSTSTWSSACKSPDFFSEDSSSDETYRRPRKLILQPTVRFFHKGISIKTMTHSTKRIYFEFGWDIFFVAMFVSSYVSRFKF